MSAAAKLSASGARSSALVAFSRPMVLVAGGAGWGGAERYGAVGGPHRGGVGEGGEAVQGGVLGAGEFLGPVVAEQVGPGGGADDQRPAGEHPDRSAAVA